MNRKIAKHKKKALQPTQPFQRKRSLPAFPLMRRLAPAVLIIGAVCLVYANTLSVPFHFDDKTSIIENGAIKNIHNIAAIWEFSKTRFLTYLSFALNFYVHGLEIRGYHLVNILLHLICAVLVWRFTLFTFTTPGVVGTREATHHAQMIACLSGLLFAVHPVQTQAVTYIVQRAAVLATLFYLLTLFSYAQARHAHLCGTSRIQQAGWWLCFAASAGGGYFTKEIFYTIPLTLIVYEILFLKKDFTINFFIVGTTALLLAGGWFIFYKIAPDFDQLARMEVPGGYIKLTPTLYALTQLRVLVTYLRLWVLPVNLNIDYDFPLSRGSTDPTTLLSALVLLALLAAGVYCVRTGRRVCGLGIVWFFITLLVESSIIPIRDVIFEHRMYLPLVGLSMLFAAVPFSLMRIGQKPAFIFFSVVFCLFSLQTYARNNVWQSKERLWTDAITKSPRKSRPWAMRGEYYLTAGRYDHALRDAQHALAINPTDIAAYNVMGCALYLQKNYDEALRAINYALLINPFSYEHYFNRAQIYAAREVFDNATQDLTRAIGLCPHDDELYLHRGLMHLKQHNLDAALSDFTTAITINPQQHDAYFHRAFVQYLQAQYKATLEDCTAALAIKKTLEEALNLRGLAQVKLGNIDQALADFTAAIACKPDYGEAYNNRAVVLFTKKDFSGALSDVLKAINLGAQVNSDFFNMVVAHQSEKGSD